MLDSTSRADLLTPNALKELGDEDLVRLLAAGNTEAMTVVFDRYYVLMMRLALRLLRNRTEAEDVVQVSFVDFYRQIRFFDGAKGCLRAWLLQYVYGRSLNRLKSMKSRHHFDHVELSDVASAELTMPSGGLFELNGSEVKRFVEQILGTLTDKKRTIVELVCFGGMSIAEVATLTCEPRTRVQHHYYRAIAKLRASMKDAEEASQASAKLNDVHGKSSRKLPIGAKVGANEVEIG